MINREAYIESNDLSLVSALLTLGIPFVESTPFVKVKTVRGEQYKFFLQEQSICGKYKTLDMITAWNNPQFHTDNPEHPLSYLKCAYGNRERLLDKVNQSIAMVIVEKNGKMAIIPETASKESQHKIFSQF